MSQQDDAEPARPIDITPAPSGLPGGEAGPGHLDDSSGGESAPGRRRSPVRRVALGALALVGLAGVTVVGVAGARIIQQKDAVLSPPDSLGSLVRDRSVNANDTATDLGTALAAGIELKDRMSVVYKDRDSDDRSVFLFGGTALLFSPEKDLDEVLRLIGQPAGDGMREVDSGEL